MDPPLTRPIQTVITAVGRGKAWRRSHAFAQKRVLDDVEYFIKRNGGWFRHGAQGYTMELAEAGIFLGADARGYLDAEGVALVPIASMAPGLQASMADHVIKAATLAALLNKLSPANARSNTSPFQK